MKRFFVIIISVCSLYPAVSQIIGLRTNTDFSDNRKINSAFGGGHYLIINDFSQNFELHLSIDFSKIQKEFPNAYSSHSGYNSGYIHLFPDISMLYILSLSQKFIYKTGFLLSYNFIHAYEEGNPENWLRSYDSHFIGTGLIANFQYNELFNTPFNIDLFITPKYLFNLKYESDPIGRVSEYGYNLILINVQIGVSYNLK